VTAWAHIRGHPVRHDGDVWRYCDTGEPIGDCDRACILCHRRPTPSGYDPCIGYVPGAVSACCGHGVEPPHVWTAWDRRWATARGMIRDAVGMIRDAVAGRAPR